MPAHTTDLAGVHGTSETDSRRFHEAINEKVHFGAILFLP